MAVPKTEAIDLHTDEQVQLQAVAQTKDGRTSPAHGVAWTTDKPDVVIVSPVAPDGETASVKAHSIGTAVVTATLSSGVKNSVTVNVLSEVPTDLSIVASPPTTKA